MKIITIDDDPSSGKSWCGDCRNLDPIIDSLSQDDELKSKHLTLVKIYVGQRDCWRDKNNFYRKCDYKITAVPTLINTKNDERLVESECFEREKVKKLFSM